jgi:Flp pilus assembly protein TadD
MLATERTAPHLNGSVRGKHFFLRRTKGWWSAMIRLILRAVIAVIAVSQVHAAWAGDILKLTLPKHSELTPVQRLNREGVLAVEKKQYEKAAALFYKAYLYDPADPFTLNNLGYISEIEGELERAHKFYALASEQGSSADIDRSNAKHLEGKPMKAAFESLQDVPMRVNRMNVDAMELLSKNHGFQAIAGLKRALLLDASNAFTLNNLGVADESIGDYGNALKSYGAAADSHSSEIVVVTLDRLWRGKTVSAMAATSAKRLEERMNKMNPAELNAVMLTMRGVAATNRNDSAAGEDDFLQAYALDPGSAFTLNNRGFVAELEGDLEAAQFFYEKARKAGDSNARVGLATEHSAEGKKLSAVAADSDQGVDGELDKYSQKRRKQTGPGELVPRGIASEAEPGTTPTQPSSLNVSPTALPSMPQPR